MSDYPELPEKTYLGDDVCYGHEDWAMQAYVDEDRAMRANAGLIPEHATTRLIELSMVWAREADRLENAAGLRNIGTADGLRTALADLQREIALLCAASIGQPPKA